MKLTGVAHSRGISAFRRLYRSDRWPGRVVSPAVQAIPSVLGPKRALRAYDSQPSRIVVLSVYRQRNGANVRRLVSSCEGRNVEFHLWALDSTHADLGSHTRGIGPGDRCNLLNELWRDASRQTDTVIVVDDDVRLLRNWTLPALVGAMSLLGVDFAQPTHAARSPHSHTFNVRRPILAARTVQAVEIGPLFAVRAPWFDQVLPFPSDAGMGYFLEYSWAALADQGCRAAVLDCVPMQHLGAVGSSYADVNLGSTRHRDAVGAQTLDEFLASSPGYGRPLWPWTASRTDEQVTMPTTDGGA